MLRLVDLIGHCNGDFMRFHWLGLHSDDQPWGVFLTVAGRTRWTDVLCVDSDHM